MLKKKNLLFAIDWTDKDNYRKDKDNYRKIKCHSKFPLMGAGRQELINKSLHQTSKSLAYNWHY